MASLLISNSSRRVVSRTRPFLLLRAVSLIIIVIISAAVFHPRHHHLVNAQVEITPSSYIDFSWPPSSSSPPINRHEIIRNAKIRTLRIGSIDTNGHLEVRDSTILFVLLNASSSSTTTQQHKGQLRFVNCIITYMTTSEQYGSLFYNLDNSQGSNGTTTTTGTTPSGREISPGGLFHVSQTTFRSHDVVQQQLLAAPTNISSTLSSTEVKQLFFGVNFETPQWMDNRWEKFAQLRLGINLLAVSSDGETTATSASSASASVVEIMENGITMLSIDGHTPTRFLDETSPIMVALRSTPGSSSPQSNNQQRLHIVRIQGNNIVANNTHSGLRLFAFSLLDAALLNVSGNIVEKLSTDFVYDAFDICFSNISNVGEIRIDNNRIQQNTTKKLMSAGGSRLTYDDTSRGHAMHVSSCHLTAAGLPQLVASFFMRSVALISVSNNTVASFAVLPVNFKFSVPALQAAGASYVLSESLFGSSNLDAQLVSDLKSNRKKILKNVLEDVGQVLIEHNTVVHTRSLAPEGWLSPGSLTVNFFGSSARVGNISISHNTFENAQCRSLYVPSGRSNAVHVVFNRPGSPDEDVYDASPFSMSDVEHVAIAGNALDFDRTALTDASSSKCIDGHGVFVQFSIFLRRIAKISVVRNNVRVHSVSPEGMRLRITHAVEEIGLVEVSENTIDVRAYPYSSLVKTGGARNVHNATSGLTIQVLRGSSGLLPVSRSSTSSSSNNNISVFFRHPILVERNNITVDTTPPPSSAAGSGERQSAKAIGALWINDMQDHTNFCAKLSSNTLTLLGGDVPFVSPDVLFSASGLIHVAFAPNKNSSTQGGRSRAVVVVGSIEIDNNTLTWKDPTTCNLFGCSLISIFSKRLEAVTDVFSIARNKVTFSSTAPFLPDAVSNGGGENIAFVSFTAFSLDPEKLRNSLVIDPFAGKFELHISELGWMRNMSRVEVVENEVVLKARKCATFLKVASVGEIEFSSLVVDRNNVSLDLLLGEEQSSSSSSPTTTTTCAGVGVLFTTFPDRTLPLSAMGQTVLVKVFQSVGHATRIGISNAKGELLSSSSALSSSSSLLLSTFSKNYIRVTKSSIASSVIHLDRANLTSSMAASIFNQPTTGANNKDGNNNMMVNHFGQPALFSVCENNQTKSSALTISENDIVFENCNFTGQTTSSASTVFSKSAFLGPCQFLTMSGEASDEAAFCFRNQSFQTSLPGTTSFIETSTPLPATTTSSSSGQNQKRRLLHFAFVNSTILLHCNTDNKMFTPPDGDVDAEKRNTEECSFIREKTSSTSAAASSSSSSPVDTRPLTHVVVHGGTRVNLTVFHGDRKNVAFFSGAFASYLTDVPLRPASLLAASSSSSAKIISSTSSSIHVGNGAVLGITERTPWTLPLKLSIADVSVGTRVSFDDANFLHTVAPRTSGFHLVNNSLSWLQQRRTLIRYATKKFSEDVPPPPLDWDKKQTGSSFVVLLVNVSNLNITADGSVFGATKNDYRLTDVGDLSVRSALVPASSTTAAAPAPQEDDDNGGDASSPTFYRMVLDCIWINANPQPQSAIFFDNLIATLSRRGIVNIGFKMCPGTATVSHTESISVVPVCSPFRFVLADEDNKNLAVDEVRGSTRTLRWMLMLDTVQDTPAPLAYGFRVVKPTSPPAGQIQSDAVTHFRYDLKNLSRFPQLPLKILPDLTGDGGGGDGGGGDSSSNNKDGNTMVARISNQTEFVSYASQFIITTQVVFDETLNPDREYTLRINMSSELLSCRYQPFLDRSHAIYDLLMSTFDYDTKLALKYYLMFSGGRGGLENLTASSESDARQLAAFMELRSLILLELKLKPRYDPSLSSLISSSKTMGHIASIVTLPVSGPMVGMALSRIEALVSIFRCPTSRDADAPLDFVESPLGMKSGATWGKYYRGAVVGNLAIVSAALGCMVAAALFKMFQSMKQKKEKQDEQEVLQSRQEMMQMTGMPTTPTTPPPRGRRNDHSKIARHTKARDAKDQKTLPFFQALTATQFPSLLLIPFSFLLQGTVSSGAAVLFRRVSMTLEEGAGPNDRFVGGFGIGLYLFLLLGCILVVFWRLPKEHWVVWKPFTKEDNCFPVMSPSDLKKFVRKLFPGCERCLDHVQQYREEVESNNKSNKKLQHQQEEDPSSTSATAQLEYSSPTFVIPPSSSSSFGSGGGRNLLLLADNPSMTANFSFTAFDDPQERIRSQRLQPRTRRPSMLESFMSRLLKTIFFLTGAWVYEAPASKTKSKKKTAAASALPLLPRGDPEFLNRFGRCFHECEADGRWYTAFHFFEGIVLGIISGYLRQSGSCSEGLMLVTSILVVIGFVVISWKRPRRRSTANVYLITMTAFELALCMCGVVSYFNPDTAVSAGYASVYIQAIARYVSFILMLIDGAFFFFIHVAPQFPLLVAAYFHYRRHRKPPQGEEDDAVLTLRDLMHRRESQLDETQLEEKSRIIQNKVEHYVAPKPNVPRKRKDVSVCWDVLHDPYVSTPKNSGGGGGGGSGAFAGAVSRQQQQRSLPSLGAVDVSSSSPLPRSAAANQIGPRESVRLSPLMTSRRRGGGGVVAGRSPNRVDPEGLRGSDLLWPISNVNAAGGGGGDNNIASPSSPPARVSSQPRPAGDVFNQQQRSPSVASSSSPAVLWARALGVDDSVVPAAATPVAATPIIGVKNKKNKNTSSGRYDPVLDGLDDDDEDDLAQYFSPKASDARRKTHDRHHEKLKMQQQQQGSGAGGGGGGANVDSLLLSASSSLSQHPIEDDIVLRRKDDTGNWSGPEVRDFANKAALYALL